VNWGRNHFRPHSKMWWETSLPSRWRLCRCRYAYSVFCNELQ